MPPPKVYKADKGRNVETLNDFRSFAFMTLGDLPPKTTKKKLFLFLSWPWGRFQHPNPLSLFNPLPLPTHLIYFIPGPLRQCTRHRRLGPFLFNRAASESLERCRAHAEKSADRTTAAVDAWLAERRQRWEAGKTRCHELAPPPPPPLREEGEGAVGASSSEASALLEDGSGGPAAAATAGGAGGVGGGEPSEWNWERGAEGGAGFDDFFETFAGGGLVEAAERLSGGGVALKAPA